MRYLTLFITLCVLSMASWRLKNKKSETPSKVNRNGKICSTAFADALKIFMPPDYSNAEKNSAT